MTSSNASSSEPRNNSSINTPYHSTMNKVEIGEGEGRNDDKEGVIRPIDESSIRRIVAGQAVYDLSSAIKELIENAMDAQARNIVIRLTQSGMEKIEVSDDGVGVPKASRPLMALPHATSKLQSFEDLTLSPNLSLGFRGEALFCLANLSEELVITTKSAEDHQVGEKLYFLRNGSLDTHRVTHCTRTVGTTVFVHKLFHNLPVRRTDLIKRLKTQRARLLKTVQAYAIVSTNVKFTLIDIKGRVGSSSFKTDVRLSTGMRRSSTSGQEEDDQQQLRDNVSSVMGPKFLAGLCPIEIDLTQVLPKSTMTKTTGVGDEENDNDSELGELSSSASTAAAKTSTVPQSSLNATKHEESTMKQWRIVGLVSKAPNFGPVTIGETYPGLARELQLFRLNGNRLVDLPKMSRLLSDVWREFDNNTSGSGSKQRPACILDLYLPNFMVDVNLSPDKREILLTNEQQILQAFRQGLSDLWTTQSSTFQVNEVESESNRNEEDGRDGQRRKKKQRLLKGNDSRKNFPTTPSRLVSASIKPTSATHSKSPLSNEESATDSNAPRPKSPPTPPLQLSQSPPPPQSNDNRDSSSASVGKNVWNQTRMKFNFSNDLKSPQMEDISVLQKKAVSTRISSSEETTDTNSIGTIAVNTQKRDTISGRNARKARLSFKEQVALLRNLKKTHTANDNKPCIKVNFTERKNFIMAAQARRSSTTAEHNKEFDQEQSNKSLPSATEETRNAVTKIGASASPKDDGGASVPEPAPITHEKAKNIDEHVSVNDEPQSQEQTDKSVIWGKFAGTQDVLERNKAARKMSREYREFLGRAKWSRLRSKYKMLSSSDKGKIIPSELALNDGSLMTQDPEEEPTTTGTTMTLREAKESSLALSSSSTVSFSKQDFGTIEIIGQFNLGFILARCNNHSLWILDQHACDEKYNFEDLCRNTRMHEQTLIAPLPLELSPTEADCIADNLSLFEMNGFRFAFDDNKPPRNRVSLTAVPHSGSGFGRRAVQFGKEDVMTLCSMLLDDSDNDGYRYGGGTGADGSGSHTNHAVRRYAGAAPTTTTNANHSMIVRLPKAVAMFASRACRGSIMIGKALSQNEMESVVRKMQSVEQPWHCPHGRPTMRHVKDILDCIVESEQPQRTTPLNVQSLLTATSTFITKGPNNERRITTPQVDDDDESCNEDEIGCIDV